MKKLLKGDEDKKNKKMEQMSKDLNDIKRMPGKLRTYAQVAATGPSENHQGIPINHRNLSTEKEKIK